MEHSKETIAMLIDADNSPSDKIDFILSEMAKYGVVNIRRAYGNWKSHSLKGWENKLHDYAIRPIQQFDYTKGKNATDMAMTIDAMDLLYSKKLDAFCIVSSDSDFTPLVMRILSEGLNVYGFGQKSAPAPFVNACSTFLYVESFDGGQEKSRNDGGRRKNSQQLKNDSKLLTLLRNAVDSVEEEDGWSNLAKIGKHISNQASFDPRNYGFKRLSDLIRSIDLFEIEFRNNNSELYIREKRKAHKPDGGKSEEVSVASETSGSHRSGAEPDSPGHSDRQRSSRSSRYRYSSSEHAVQDSDGAQAPLEPDGDKGAELRAASSRHSSRHMEPASVPVVSEPAVQKSDAPSEVTAFQAESGKSPKAESVEVAQEFGRTSQPELPASSPAVRKSETPEAEVPVVPDSKGVEIEAPAPKKASQSRSSTARSGARKSVTRTTRKASSTEAVAAQNIDAGASVPAPATPSMLEIADPKPLAEKASESALAESAPEQPEAAEAKLKKTARVKTTKPRVTSARSPKAATAEKSEAPKKSEQPDPEQPAPAELSVVMPEAEPKPKRTTRRRTTRKKSEPKSGEEVTGDK